MYIEPQEFRRSLSITHTEKCIFHIFFIFFLKIEKKNFSKKKSQKFFFLKNHFFEKNFKNFSKKSQKSWPKKIRKFFNHFETKTETVFKKKLRCYGQKNNHFP